MLSNSAFRDLLTAEKPDKPDRARDDSKQAKAARAAKAKAGHERRMQIQKRKEEALAAQAKYRDRAEERRKEIEKEGGGVGPTPEFEEETDEQQALPSGPTFAQIGNREDLSQQKHRLTIAQSKYLGGDIEHTHLVKGLDYALLQKRRAELTNAEKAEEAKRLEREAQRAARTDAAGAGRTIAASLTAAAKGKPAAAGTKAGNAAVAAKPEVSQLKLSSAKGDMARGVLRALAGPPSRPNRSLASGRLVFVFDVSESAATDKPTSLVRAEDDLGIVRPRNDLGDAALQAPLLARLGKVMSYVARSGAERSRKPRKEKQLAPSVLLMRPLKARPAPEAAAERSRWQDAPTPASQAAAASSEGATASLVGSKRAPPPPPPLAKDVDDIFGDGSGSDYVCKPSEAQLKQAEREKRVKEVLRKEEGSYFDREEEEDEDEDAAMEEDEGSATGEASSLLTSALGGDGGERRARAPADGEEKQGAKAAGKDKNKLAMGSVASDSYAECFPESYEGYNLELHGPDSDDETGVVRSTRKGEEEEEPSSSGKTGKGGKRVDREAQKKEAKMSRDLVQIEKLMEERKKKRQRGEDRGFGDADESHVDQNELF